MLSPEKSRELAERTLALPMLVGSHILTCETCEYNDDCDYAFDPYNTDGDCLAMK